MNPENESIDRYLKTVVPPEPPCGEHRQQLRGRILGELEHSRCAPRTSQWRICAAVAGAAGVAGVGAAVGFGLQHFYFDGQRADGTFLFSRTPEIQFQQINPADDSGQGRVTFTKFTGVMASPEELEEGGIEQFQKDLEEIELLRERNARNLTGVVDTEFNGRCMPRICIFRYTLAGGRTRIMREADPDEEQGITPEQMSLDQDQIDALRKAGHRDVIRVMETEWKGGLSRTLICRYTLSDGREIVVGEGDPDFPPPANFLSDAQHNELWKLMRLQQGQFLGTIEKVIAGKVFNLDQHLYILSDGVSVIHLDGQLKGQKTELVPADLDQMRQLQGELIAIYQQDVKGKPFLFQRKRFILNDGTVVIRSFGEPK